MASYFNQKALEALLRVELPFSKKLNSLRKGSHNSRITGQNVDFKEHREYVQGDDVTKIDWKLFARTEKLFLKEFEEDASANILVIIDKSASMNYSSGKNNKLEYAKFLFATIYTVFTRQKDRIALCVFDEDLKTLIPFSVTSNLIPVIDEKLKKLKPEGKTQTENLITSIKNNYKRNIDITFILSDLIINENKITDLLFDLKYISKQCFLLHLVDPTEENFDFQGEYVFKDYETNNELIMDAGAVAKYYNNYFQSHLKHIRETVLKTESYYFKMNIKESYIANFMNFVNRYYQG